MYTSRNLFDILINKNRNVNFEFNKFVINMKITETQKF